MDQDSSFVVTPRTVLGVAIVLLGFALALDRLGIVEANHILRFWPVPLILIGALMVVQARDGRERTRGLVFAGIGTWFFLYSEGLVTVRIWELFWPVILMLIGFSLVFRTGGPRRRRYRRYGGGWTVRTQRTARPQWTARTGWTTRSKWSIRSRIVGSDERVRFESAVRRRRGVRAECLEQIRRITIVAAAIRRPV